jgi:hypothetical protein
MHLEKQDLCCTYYIWEEENESKYLGQPSRRLFNRFNGDQVLFLINFYGSMSDQFTLEEGRKIERQISEFLPIDMKSEISVFNWIKELKDRIN